MPSSTTCGQNRVDFFPNSSLNIKVGSTTLLPATCYDIVGNTLPNVTFNFTLPNLTILSGLSVLSGVPQVTVTGIGPGTSIVTATSTGNLNASIIVTVFS